MGRHARPLPDLSWKRALPRSQSSALRAISGTRLPAYHGRRYLFREYHAGERPAGRIGSARSDHAICAGKTGDLYRGRAASSRGSTTALAWARLFYLYGPGESPRRLVPDVIAGLLKHERVATTAGTQVRDFLHVADVARALTAVALSPLQGAVNLGSGDPIRVLDIVETIAAITGRRDLIDVGARPENLVDPPYVSADNRRLVEETGWRPHYTLAAGLADTVEWWRRTLTPLPAGERIVPPDLGPLDR